MLAWIQSHPVASPIIALVLTAALLPSAVEHALPILREARPAVVQLHAGPVALVEQARAASRAVRAALPGVRLWVGVPTLAPLP